MSVQAPDEGEEASYWSHHVVLVNPLGGRNNWSSVASWIRLQGGEKARRAELAGLASEDRPDEEANWQLLTDASATHGRAVILPPDEAFSQSRAAEVSYIYGVPVETLRAWKRKYRSELASRKRADPKNGENRRARCNYYSDQRVSRLPRRGAERQIRQSGSGTKTRRPPGSTCQAARHRT